MTTPYERAQLASIRSVVRAELAAATQAGRAWPATLVYRNPASPDGLALLEDGSSNPVPVKIYGGVVADEGDRVGVILIGSLLYVVGSYRENGLGEAATRSRYTTTHTTTSGTSVEIGEATLPAAVIKRRDATALSIRGFTTCYSSNATTGPQTEMALTMRVQAVDPGNTYNIVHSLGGFFFNLANTHLPVVGHNRVVPPAGQYLVSLMWRRDQGTGTLTVDANDYWGIEVDEIRRGF
jgi:hypothetical protein